jgi:hypothetical protein
MFSKAILMASVDVEKANTPNQIGFSPVWHPATEIDFLFEVFLNCCWALMTQSQKGDGM